MKIDVDLDEKQVNALRGYRKFLNRTRGVTYTSFQEMLDTLTKMYLVSLSNQMRQMKREKVSKAYRNANKDKTDQVDLILEVTDE